jgi:hypothetical protein
VLTVFVGPSVPRPDGHSGPEAIARRCERTTACERPLGISVTAEVRSGWRLAKHYAREWSERLRSAAGPDVYSNSRIANWIVATRILPLYRSRKPSGMECELGHFCWRQRFRRY